MKAGKIRYAVVGLGHIAQVAVLPAFKEARNSELTTLVSADDEKLRKLAKKYRLQNVYSYKEYDRALSDVDAVYIALPNHLHREYSVRAAQAGVHVLCEKPMAVREQDCEAMIAAARENNVRLMVAYRLHFDKGTLEAIRVANSGKLGALRFFSSDFAQVVQKDNVRLTESSERGGGPVYDMGVYCINAARYLFRSEPTEVHAVAARDGQPKFLKAGEMVSVTMRFPEDRLATFTCSFGAADIGRYTVVGTKGTLTADPAYEYAEEIKHQLNIGGKIKTPSFPKRDQFAAEIVYFSDCILNNREPEASGLEGLADVRIVRAIYDSVRTGKGIKIRPVPKATRPSLKQEIHRRPHGKPYVVKAKSPSGQAA